MRVFQIEPHSDPRWERYLAEHPEGTIYHHPAWIRALEMEYGQKGVNLACEDSGGGLRAILPMLYTQGLPFQKRSRLYGRRLSSLPRTPIAGPLFTDVDAGRAVLERAVRELGGNGGIQLQIKMQDDRLDGLIHGLVGVPWRVSYVVPLESNGRGVFEIKNAHHRRNVMQTISRAERRGVTTRHADTESDLHIWYGLYLDSMRRNAVPPRSYRFFLNVWRLLRPKGLLDLILAEHETGARRRIIAGTVYLNYGNTYSAAFAGSSQKDLALAPNDVVAFRALNEALGKGCSRFDFGEVPEEREGLAWFKVKFGGQPVRLHRYYFPAREGSDPGVNRTGRYSPGMVEAVWRRLPLWATAFLGDQTYRFL